MSELDHHTDEKPRRFFGIAGIGCLTIAALASIVFLHQLRNVRSSPPGTGMPALAVMLLSVPLALLMGVLGLCFDRPRTIATAISLLAGAAALLLVAA